MTYAGSDRVVAITPEQLHRVPVAIAVAAGAEKVVSLRAAARGGYINRLVTDAHHCAIVINGGTLVLDKRSHLSYRCGCRLITGTAQATRESMWQRCRQW